MNYNRLLDIDFVSSSISSRCEAHEKKSLAGTEYQGTFDFTDSTTARYLSVRETHLTHTSRNRAVILDKDILSPASQGLYPDQRDGKLSRQLCELTYIHTYADLHKIKQNPDATYPCLQKLMRWVCDAMTTGKIVIRVHGSAYQPTAMTGFVHEGNTSVSIRKVIACFIKNGLCASSEFRLLGIKTQPGKKPREMWQPDNSASRCAHPNCTRSFKLFVRRHHCRRCGKIFCDRHSSKTRRLHEALSKTAGKTKLNGEAVRVCDRCADEYDNAARENGTADQRRSLGTHTGSLRTFKIFSCQAASHSSERTMGQRPAEAQFDIGSIAHEAVEAFRAGNVLGVKVTASPFTVTQKSTGFVFGPSYTEYTEGSQFSVSWPTNKMEKKSVSYESRGFATLPTCVYGDINIVHNLIEECKRKNVDAATALTNFSSTSPSIDRIQANPQDRRRIFFGGAQPAQFGRLKLCFKGWTFAGCKVFQTAMLGYLTFSIIFPEKIVEKVEFPNPDQWKIFWADNGSRFETQTLTYKHTKVSITT
jgi:hypothetical protein